MADHIYVYGIVEDADLSFDATGVGGATEIRTVAYRSLSAVVSEIDTTDPERTDAAVERHNEVLGTVLEEGYTVVPMSFGMAFKNARTLKGVLRGANRALRKTLNDIDGTVELGVKLVDTGLEADPEAVRAEIGDRLDEVAINDTDDDLFSDRLVLNRSYLVDRDERDRFDAAIDDIRETYGDGLTVQYTGPWAPYNFVDVHIGADRGS